MTIPIPPGLELPADQKFCLELRAVGVQVYICRRQANAFVWQLKEPVADLYDTEGKLVGRHYSDFAKDGPAWFCTGDGSEVVVDAKQAKRAAAPNSIPSLLVPRKGPLAAGILGNVKSVHRLATLGGVAPTIAAAEDELREVRVYYSATYYFNA